MKGPCLCGDPACWSCGPPQGFDPGSERQERDEMEMTFNEKVKLLGSLVKELPEFVISEAILAEKTTEETRAILKPILQDVGIEVSSEWGRAYKV